MPRQLMGVRSITGVEDFLGFTRRMLPCFTVAKTEVVDSRESPRAWLYGTDLAASSGTSDSEDTSEI
jgi:hypothetical protein